MRDSVPNARYSSVCNVLRQWSISLIPTYRVYRLMIKNIFFNEQKVGMLLQKRTDTRGVGISSMRKSIYLLTTTPTSHTRILLTTPTNHTHTFHPLSRIVIHTFNFAQVKSMEISHRGRWWCLKCVIVYLARDIPAFVMYCVNGASRTSLVIESTNSMIYVHMSMSSSKHKPCLHVALNPGSNPD